MIGPQTTTHENKIYFPQLYFKVLIYKKNKTICEGFIRGPLTVRIIYKSMS